MIIIFKGLMNRYKEALFDCNQALNINPKFAKAHIRAHKCYLNLGDLKVLKLLIKLILFYFRMLKRA